ncbi:MAG: hypothetical protein V4812_20415 [Pseudomonadota bacterium]
MKLSRLEAFALEKLLEPHPADQLVATQPALQVLERVRTRAGFYSIIQLPAGLRVLQERTELEWAFKHKRLKSRGYFVCWGEPDATLCLEAVISKGACPPEWLLEPFA